MALKIIKICDKCGVEEVQPTVWKSPLQLDPDHLCEDCLKKNGKRKRIKPDHFGRFIKVLVRKI